MLWGDVYSAAGAALGDGPVLLQGANINRVLDGVGTISIRAVFDPTNEALLKVGRKVFIYRLVPTPTPAPLSGEDFSSPQLLGQMVIRDVKRQINEPSLNVSGVDLLEELKFYSTLLARRYDTVALGTVVSSLAALAGWTAVTDVTSTVLEARFDGTSILKALQEIIKNNGIHLRLGLNTRQIEVGAFGTSSGVRLVHSNSAAVRGQNVLPVTQIAMQQDGDAVINWVLPVGAGEGEAALTLKNSTRSGISTLVDNGRTQYYLKDDASIAAYGVRMKVGVFKDIAPLNNSVVSKRVAANALYDAAAAYLARSKDVVTRYSVDVLARGITVRAGDKVRLTYSGIVQRLDGESYETIDADLWVMDVSESYDDGGGQMSLELATLDKVKMDGAAVVIGALETFEVRNLRPQAYPISFSFAGNDVVSARTVGSFSRWADFAFRVDNKITDIQVVTLTLLTRPLFTYNYSRMEPGVVTGVNSVAAFPHTHTLPGVNLTSLYDVVESTNYPSDITLWINGVDVSATYGGPWNASPTNLPIDLVLDITGTILAAATIYQKHTIQIRCGVRTGNIVVPGYPGSVIADISAGIVSFGINVQGVCQAILSS